MNCCTGKNRRYGHPGQDDERGSALVELALVMQVLVLMLVVLVDLGRAYYYAISISSASHAAALYGLQNPTDLDGIKSAASSSASDISSLSTSVSYGCECHDGSSVVADCSTPPSCSDNYVNFVSTTTTATFRPLLPYPGMPSSFTLSRSARLRSGGRLKVKTAAMSLLRKIVVIAIGDESGANTLEFSITLSLLFSCVFGIMVCSMALYADHFVTDAAKEATRYAMVRGSSWGSTSCSSYSSYSCVASSSNVTSFVNSIAPPGIATSNINVTTSWPGTDPTGQTCDTAQGNNSPACVVNVQVQYTFNFLLPFVPFGTVNLAGVSSDVIIR